MRLNTFYSKRVKAVETCFRSRFCEFGARVSASVDSNGRTIWIADAHRDDGKRLSIGRNEEKLTTFLELEYDDSRLRRIGLDKLARFSLNSPAMKNKHSTRFLNHICARLVCARCGAPTSMSRLCEPRTSQKIQHHGGSPVSSKKPSSCDAACPCWFNSKPTQNDLRRRTSALHPERQLRQS